MINRVFFRVARGDVFDNEIGAADCLMAKNYPYEVIILCVLAKGMDCSGKITESTGVIPVEMSPITMFNSLVNLDFSNINESQCRML